MSKSTSFPIINMIYTVVKLQDLALFNPCKIEILGLAKFKSIFMLCIIILLQYKQSPITG